MLNIPYCINNTNIPLEMSLTAPYKSFKDLEMIVELSRASCERLTEYDVRKISQSDLDSNNCNEMQTKFSSIKKFCGVCKFSDSSILERLTDELVLLNHLFHHGPDERISIEQFKYYFLDQNFNPIPITSTFFNLIIDHFGTEQNLADTLTAWSKDNDYVDKMAYPMIQKIFDNSNNDIDKSIMKLKKTLPKKKAVKHTDVLSLLISNQNLVNGKKEQKKKTSSSSSLEKKNEKKPKSETCVPQQLPGQLNMFENSESVDISQSTTYIDPLDSHAKEESLSLSTKEITLEEAATIKLHDSFTASYLSIDEINTLSIVSGTVFITTNEKLLLSVHGNGDTISSYYLNHDLVETKEFVNHLFMNKNVLKIIDDLCNLRMFIHVKTFNSTLDISILSKESNIIDYYSKVVKQYTVEQLEVFKRKNIIKIITKINVSESSNVIFKVVGKSDFFETVLFNAYKSKLFDKYCIHVSKCNRNVLELNVDINSKSVIVDFFLSLIRSELKRSNLNREIEVIMK